MVAPPSGHLAPALDGSKDSRPLDRLNYYIRNAEIVKDFLDNFCIKIPLIYKLIYGLVEVHEGFIITAFHIAQTMLDMVLEDYLGGVVEGRPDGGKLDKHLGAVTPILHHALDRFKMAYGP
jgi:hypothetical protein